MNVWDGYDSWKCSPPEPSKDELYIDEQVEKRCGAIERELAEIYPEWFSNCVDWDSVAEHIAKEVEQELKDQRGEAEIAAWEARNEQW